MIMGHVSERLTTAEAAAVADVPVRDVNRMYDEKLLPEDLLLRAYLREDHDRLVAAWACTLIAFYFKTAEQLTVAERLKAISASAQDVNNAFNNAFWMYRDDPDRSERMRARLEILEMKRSKAGDGRSELNDNRLLFHDSFLTIDWKPFVRKTHAGFRRLSQAKSMVETSPHILGGTPVIAGTRVPVYDVAASVEKGIPIEDILDAYPSITLDQILLAAFYAEAVPARGRPKKSSLPAGAKIVAKRRVRRGSEK
jgi:uncharacterized protein (DUF433 family)